MKRFFEAKSYFESHYKEFCQLVVENLRTRLQWPDMQLFQDVIVVLATQRWEKILQDEQNNVVDIEDAGDDGNDDSRSDSLDAVDRLANHFKVPLETAGADINEIREEFKSI